MFLIVESIKSSTYQIKIMETNYQDQLKNWMTEWQSRFEEMRVQFTLGKMDAVDAFEKQKEQMRNAMLSLKENLDKATDMSEEQMQKLKIKMEELQVQLALGKAEGADLFHEQKKKIEAAMDALKAESKNAYHKGFEQAMNVYDHNAKAFKTGIEIVQLQYALAKMDAKDDAEKIRKELTEKTNEMNALFTQGQQMFVAQMEEWNKQWQAGFDKMKDWAQQWSKK
jgi:hypothetical protein